MNKPRSKSAIRAAEKYKKKVADGYVVVNIWFHQDDIDRIDAYIEETKAKFEADFNIRTQISRTEVITKIISESKELK